MGTDLHNAALLGCLGKVQKLLRTGADHSVMVDNVGSPLHLAAANGELKIVQALLKAGANHGLVKKDGYTPLHSASACGKVPVVRELLRAGANHALADKNGFSPLHVAVICGQVTVVKELLANGADHGAVNCAGNNPLHIAAATGQVTMLRALLKAGGDPLSRNKTGGTSLHSAALEGREEALLVLLRAKREAGASQDDVGYTPLHSAALSGNLGVLQLLLKEGVDPAIESKSGSTPLSLAVGAGHVRLVQELMNSPRVGTEKGVGHLHQTARNGQVDVMRVLLMAGVDHGALDKDGLSPLHLAAKQGHLDAVRALLTAGANPALEGLDGFTPLDTAAANGRVGVVKEFIKLGVDRESNWKRPLFLAVCRGWAEVVMELLKAGGVLDKTPEWEAEFNAWASNGNVANAAEVKGVVRGLLLRAHAFRTHHWQWPCDARGIKVQTVAPTQDVCGKKMLVVNTLNEYGGRILVYMGRCGDYRVGYMVECLPLE